MSNIIKNENLIKNISNIILNNKLTNSYIIHGISGSGKTLMANYFAKSLLCENFNNKPCGHCNNCLNFDKGNLTDVKYVKSKKASLSIDEVRDNIITDVITKPQSMNYKIYIIEVDDITIAAQNALLKTIEQPPPYAVFIFTTSKINTFLPTILSRCTQFSTQYLSIDDIYLYLQNQHYEYPNIDLQCVSNFDTGSIGQALCLLNNHAFQQQRIDILNILTDVNKADILNCINLAKQTESYKKDIELFYSITNTIYRDLIVYKTTKNINLIKQQDISDKIILTSELFTISKLTENFNYINSYHSIKYMNNNFTLGLETLFLKLSNVS